MIRNYICVLFVFLFQVGWSTNVDSLRMSFKVENDTSLVDSLIGKAERLKKAYRFNDAIIQLELAQTLSPNTGQLANIRNTIGLCYSYTGAYLMAMPHFQEAAELFRQIGDTARWAKSLNNVGQANRYIGKYDLAIDYLYQSLKVKEMYAGETSVDYLRTLNNVGNLYLFNQDIEKAWEVFSEVGEIAERGNVQEFVAASHTGFGLVYSHKNELQKAVEEYKNAVRIYKKQNLINDLDGEYSNIALSYQTMGVTDSAIVYYDKAYQIADSIGSERNKHAIQLNKAIAYGNSGNYKKAIADLEQVIRYFDEIGYLEGNKEALKQMSIVKEGDGDYEGSLIYYKKYTAVKDSLFNESKSKEIGKLEAQYEMEKKQEEEKRKAELLKLKEQKEKSRRDNLQFSGIFVFVLLLFATVFMSGKFSMSEKFAEGLIFFTFLLFFEFCLVLIDPLVEEWSGGEPLFKLLFNAILAGLIFPLHAFFESTLKKKLLKKGNKIS